MNLGALTTARKVMIGGGLGVAGLGLMKLTGGGGGGVDPSTKDPKAGGKHGGKADGAGTAGAATDPAAAATGGLTDPAAAGAGAGASAAGLPEGATQQGPYTLVPDPSGVQLVYETATETPVGIVDETGNFVSIEELQGGSATAAPGAATAPTSAASATGIGAPTAQAQAGTAMSADYEALAASLFAAPSATGGGGLSPTSTTDASAGASALGAATPYARATEQYSVVEDPASGLQVVVDTATQEPMGILDDSGNFVPIDEAEAMMTASSSPTASATGTSAAGTASAMPTPSPTPPM